MITHPEAIVDLTAHPQSVYVLAGLIEPDGLRGNSGPMRLTTGMQVSLEIPSRLVAVLEYFRCMRSEDQARDRLRTTKSPSSLAALISSGHLVRVATSQGGAVLDLPSGVRLEPLSVVTNGSRMTLELDTPMRAYGLDLLPIGEFLAALIFDRRAEESIGQALERTASAFNLPAEQANRLLAAALPELIARGYVHFTTVTGPAIENRGSMRFLGRALALR